MSDENTHAPKVIEIMSWLGRLAKGKSDQLRGAVAKAVAAFYSEQPNHALKQGTSNLQLKKLCMYACIYIHRACTTLYFHRASNDQINI